MAKYLIEVPHEASPAACRAAIQIFLNTGSHFLSHADWGCLDGMHKAWIVVDVNDREEARNILPPAYRSQANIVSLNKFSLDASNEVVAQHME